MSTYDCDPLVIDHGTSMTKCGRAGDDAPRAVFPTTIGQKEGSVVTVGMDDSGSNSIITYPMARGIVIDWDAMEKVWHHIFYNECRVAPEHHDVLLTEAPLNPRANRKRLTKIMFETFGVQGVYLANQGVMSLIAGGGTSRTTGIVMDSGGRISHAIPVYEGYAISHASSQLDLAGDDLTTYMEQLLCEHGCGTADAKLDVASVRCMRQKLCQAALNFDLDAPLTMACGVLIANVSIQSDTIHVCISNVAGVTLVDVCPLPPDTTIANFEDEIKKLGWPCPEVRFLSEDGSDVPKTDSLRKHDRLMMQQDCSTYEHPDGSVTSVSRGICLQCPEVLFHPTLIGKQSGGVHNMIFEAIMKCDVDIRKELFANIVLCGGGTTFAGIAERTTKELSALAPSTMQVKVIAPPERHILSWIGGSIVASMNNDAKWIRRSDYDESGANIVNAMCF